MVHESVISGPGVEVSEVEEAQGPIFFMMRHFEELEGRKASSTPPRSDPLGLRSSGWSPRARPVLGARERSPAHTEAALEDFSCNIRGKGLSIFGEEKSSPLGVH